LVGFSGARNSVGLALATGMVRYSTWLGYSDWANKLLFDSASHTAAAALTAGLIEWDGDRPEPRSSECSNSCMSVH